MKQKLISGFVVPLITPMNEDYSIDRIALKTLIARLMNKGAKNFFVLNQFSEYQFLDNNNQKEIIGVVDSVIGGKGNLLIGCFEKSTEEIIEKVKFAQRFTNFCVINIPYSALTNEVLFIDFFDKLFTQTKANIFICNDPLFFRRNIPIIGLERIANWEKLLGVIDYSGNINYFKALAEHYQSVKVFQGKENNIVDSIDYHCSGAACLFSNLFPYFFIDIEKQTQTDVELMRKQSKINITLKDFFPLSKKIQAIKYALFIEGITQGYFSKELEELDDKEQKKIESFFEKSLA